MEQAKPLGQHGDFLSGDSRYRSLFEGIPIGLYITTLDGRIVDANPALVQMLGYSNKKALLGIMAADLYANPADRKRERFLLETDHALHNFETQLNRMDGRLIWVRDSCHAVRDEEGTILYFEGSLQDITEEKASGARLNHMARHDPLTGVFNRYALSEVLERESSRAQRYNHPIGVLMIDVNRFKEANDRFGHAAGDKVLQMVAEVLCSCVRDTDYVVRYGGDEFLLLLLETNGETQIVRDRIVETLSSKHSSGSLVDFPITLSIGVAHWLPETNESVESILSRADHAMYAEKRKQVAAQADMSA